ncbi:MAG TPA: DUF6259 domain-containing protein [Thermoanaerobaculia bacterium]|jgi:hypothetical protein
MSVRLKTRAAAFAAALIAVAMQGDIKFSESPDELAISNNFYEIRFSRTNGGITAIKTATSAPISAGSNHRCLWWAYHEQRRDDGRGGCSFSGSQFGYAWSAAQSELTLTYKGTVGTPAGVDVTVTITPLDSPNLDFRIRFKNSTGNALQWIQFPSELVFEEADLERVLLPVLPGVIVTRRFFDQNRSFERNYGEGPGVFADFVALETPKGNFAQYVVGGDGVPSTHFGVRHSDPGDQTLLIHQFGWILKDGESWSSPVVRMRIGRPTIESVRAYATDNSFASFPSLKEKLGTKYDATVSGPFIKVAVHKMTETPFSSYSALLDQLPTPSILHLVAFHKGGFDENYPDFMPPDPKFGTTAELVAVIRNAQQRGLLVMPYINPTWWDDQGPTLTSLPPPLTIRDVAVINPDGTPKLEKYGMQLEHSGYAMCPYAPFVKEKLASVVQSVTETLPSDMLFEDQIGARGWIFDYNPAEPNPASYLNGWLDHTRQYKSKLLSTEMGVDRLAETEFAFFGNVSQFDAEATENLWGNGNWEPFPFATMILRDRALFYQHDLVEAPLTTVSKKNLRFNLSMGSMLTYDFFSKDGDQKSLTWLPVAAAFQKHVLSQYASELVRDYQTLIGGAMKTTFDTFSVIANLNEQTGYPDGELTIAPGGVAAFRNDRKITGGVFSRFAGADLSSGDHYLIEQRGSGTITIRQPMGADTPMTIAALPWWTNGDHVAVKAMTKTGVVASQSDATVSGGHVTFLYASRAGDVTVERYDIVGREARRRIVAH